MTEKYKILAIGTNSVPRHNKSTLKLKFAEKDAQSIAKYFETLNNYAQVTLLTNLNATRANIFNWLEQCNLQQEKLTLIIYFAGHGSAELDKHNKKLERCLWIDSHKDIENKNHIIKTKEILSCLNNPSHRLIFIIDACYEFSFTQNSKNNQEFFKQFEESERLLHLNQYIILSSAAVSKSAIEDLRLQHGLLTYYFLKTISGQYTFFLKKRIPCFKFLEIMARKIMNHRVLSQNGRLRSLSALKENGIMVHYNDRNLYFPILEPRPFISTDESNTLQRTVQLILHFFSSTRLRAKLSFAISLLVFALVLVYQSNRFILYLKFEPRQYTLISQFPGWKSIILDKLTKNQIIPEKNISTIFLFKHNWPQALLPKLNDEGKITLLGHALGLPIKHISKNSLVKYALSNIRDIFYWSIQDILSLLATLKLEYKNLSPDRKWDTLLLLATLGSRGKHTAQIVFDFKTERDQKLRNLFLEHFFSIQWLEKNLDYFNQQDLLFLSHRRIHIPESTSPQLEKNITVYLQSFFQQLSPVNLPIKITQTDILEAIYQKLNIVAFLGSSQFRTKAYPILKSTFIPQEVLYIMASCRNFKDTLWLLDHYIKYIKSIPNGEIPPEQWDIIASLYTTLSITQASLVKKILTDSLLPNIPEIFKSSLLWSLRHGAPEVICLEDWQRWLDKYKISPYCLFISIVQMKYPGLFQFILTHYQYLKGNFTDYHLATLDKINRQKTIALAKALFPLAIPNDKLSFSVYLYNLEYPLYANYIINTLSEAQTNAKNKNLFFNFSPKNIDKTLLSIAQTHKNVKKQIQSFIKDKRFFYRFFNVMLHWWPQESIQTITASPIPYSYRDGIPLLGAVECLPQPYRKRMFLKICNSFIDETFRINAETWLANNSPKEFIAWIIKKNDLTQNQQDLLIEIYQSLTLKELKEQLITQLRSATYWKINYICQALVKKEIAHEWHLKDIEIFLEQFQQPLERILLKYLRYHLHKQYFLEEIQNESNAAIQ